MRVGKACGEGVERARWAMPHPQQAAAAHRRQFIEAVLKGGDFFAAHCRQYGYSRRVGYQWLERFEREGWAGLADRATGRAPAAPEAVGGRYRAELLAWRKARGWGPKKLWQQLRREHPRAHLPSERTIARLLLGAGCLGARQVRSRPGPEVPRPHRRGARRCHEVWTVDFKGYFQTADGSRCDALTVRDLHSRYLLLVEHVPRQSERATRAALLRCFQRHGLPTAIRVDNGAPFAGRGPRGLAQLSVWWWRLGIAVEFTRPGHPQDNGAHEQMHRVLKRETAEPPAATLRAQAARFAKFVRHYNEERWHEALGQRTPASCHQPNPRPYRPAAPLVYPPAWQTRRVMIGGRVFWQGRVRVIGRAFQREWLGFKARSQPGRQDAPPRVVEVYLGTLLLGELHADDPGGLRAVRWRKPPPWSARKKEG